MCDAQPLVLVVEDSTSIRELVATLLEEEGYAVEGAADGAVALERIAAGGVDLVLLDQHLPGLDGLEVCRRVRADELNVSILLLTAEVNEARQRALAAGANGYVPKPFDIDDLLDQVRTCVGDPGEQGPICPAELASRALDN